MKVFFDASVIIAALLSPTGGSSLLLHYTKQKRIRGIISQTVIEEIVDKDKLKKLRRSKETIELFIAQSGLIVREAITADEIISYQGQIDIEDAHLVAGAILTKCSHLVTLDKKHLLRKEIQQKFLPLTIVSPKDLLKEILS